MSGVPFFLALLCRTKTSCRATRCPGLDGHGGSLVQRPQRAAGSLRCRLLHAGLVDRVAADVPDLAAAIAGARLVAWHAVAARHAEPAFPHRDGGPRLAHYGRLERPS